MQPDSLGRTGHRSYPHPGRPWTWRQTWCDLLFAHWPVPSSLVKPLIPAELQVDEYEGTSWIGIVPFRMENVAFRPLPPIPGLSAFPELNVRLYVTHRGRPGVWFLSLDAGNMVAVWAARRFFHLPYFRAEMQLQREGESVAYRSRRLGGSTLPRFEARYTPIGPMYEATVGSLEHWLTERYCLYTMDDRGGLHRGEIHHQPWPLQPAEAELQVNQMCDEHLDIPGSDSALFHFAHRLDVVGWSLEPEGL